MLKKVLSSKISLIFALKTYSNRAIVGIALFIYASFIVKSDSILFLSFFILTISFLLFLFSCIALFEPIVLFMRNKLNIIFILIIANLGFFILAILLFIISIIFSLKLLFIVPVLIIFSIYCFYQIEPNASFRISYLQDRLNRLEKLNS